MKKKFLSFIFAICLILPCAFIMTACGDNPPPDNPPPPGSTGSFEIRLNTESDENEGVWILPADATDCFGNNDVVEDGNYSIWLADFYDKDTLEVKYDNTPVDVTLCETPGYENKTFGLNPRKIATFSVPAQVTGDHVLDITVEEEELELKFVSNGQELTDDERAVLADWYFPAEGEDITFASVLDSNYRIKATYSKLKNIGSADELCGIPLACKQKFGYYKDYVVWLGVDEKILPIAQYYAGTGNYEYSLLVDYYHGEYGNMDGYPTREIELTFYKDNLQLATLELEGENEYSGILTIVDGEQEFNLGSYAGGTWSPLNENDIKIYLEPYAGVDLSNVEVYINDTKMTLNVDPEKNNKKYLVIPKGTLPVDYYNSDKIPAGKSIGFELFIENVDISNANLISNFTVSTNSSIVEERSGGTHYFVKDGVKYYKPNAYVWASYEDGGENAKPASVKFNGTTFNLSSYTVKNMSIPIGDSYSGLDAWRDENGQFFDYDLTIGSKQVHLSISFNDDGTVFDFSIGFALTGSTNIELVF